MAARDDKPKQRVLKPATTLEGRENQLVSLAIDLVEKRMRAGTATSQEVTHFLKLGSTREILEQRRLEHEIALQAAKVEAIQSNQKMEVLYTQAINAMREYSGQPPLELEDSEEYED